MTLILVRPSREDVKQEGLRNVEITTEPENGASRRVIEANDDVLAEEFVAFAAPGRRPHLRYRVYFDG